LAVGRLDVQKLSPARDDAVWPCAAYPSGHTEDLHEADMQALNNQQDEGPRGAPVRTACLLSWVPGRDDGQNFARRSNRRNVEEP
jgi:hypothetical protein